MKKRWTFVSNSSSCSFVLPSLGKNNSFDGLNAENPCLELCIEQHIKEIISTHNLDENDPQKIRDFAKEMIRKDGVDLHATVDVMRFTPEEIVNINEHDSVLEKFISWLDGVDVDWSRRSTSLKEEMVKKFGKGEAVVVSIGRKKWLELDYVAVIDNKKIAIEIERSNNWDNGYFKLRLAVEKEQTDFGIMIVPLSHEERATATLDILSEISTSPKPVPIYCLVVLKALDLYKAMEDYKI